MGKTKADQRREQLREQLWPDSADRVWKGPEETGYWCAPRILPLLLHLTKEKGIVGEKDCSFVYLELLSRDFGQGIVEIRDEDEHAFCAGYTSNRARRTWQERMHALASAGFIEVETKGNRPLGYVLVLHPTHVVSELRRQRKVSDQWWNLLQQQLLEVGAPRIEDPLIPTELRVIPGGVATLPTSVRRRRRSGE
jgi:hypothetical protein